MSAIVLLLAITVPAGAIDPFKPRIDDASQPSTATESSVLRATGKTLDFEMRTYRGLGTWIDMYDEEPWEYPEAAVLGMVEKGARTLYLETSNWHKRSDLYKPAKLGRFIEAAHASGMEVVAWYVPGFKNMRKDKRRTLAALNFVTPQGQRFDGFALDIEATAVRDVSRRTRRMLRLTQWLRDKVGSSQVLGGIVPDVQSKYWPGFPYATLTDYYDVMMPMSYFTYRVSGARAVRKYISDNFTYLRSVSGKPNLAIHNIGGIGGRSSRREARAYVNAVIAHNGIGGSYYDYPITRPREWEELARLIDQ